MPVKEFILASRPVGLPNTSNIQLREAKPQSLADGQVQIETVYISVDPYLRGRMNEGKSYVPQFELNQPIESGGIGKVLNSKSPRFKTGDYVTGMVPWATEAVLSADTLQKIETHHDHLSLHLGALGMTGLTAYFGLLDIGKPKPKETVVVSGAAGAVGSVVGQIAKVHDCRVVGLAGSEDKVRLLKEKFGFDEVINYKTEKNLTAALAKACPKGVDVYFDNVGGEITDAVLANMNIGGRIPLCGQISQYNAKSHPTGPLPQFAILAKRLTMKGFIIFDYQPRFQEGTAALSKWYEAGLLKTEETIVEGFEKLPEALLGLFSGANTGKMIVKVK